MAMTLCWSCRRALGTMGCPWCEYDNIEHRVRFEPVPERISGGVGER
mgnify:CR=1 FL=1